MRDRQVCKGVLHRAKAVTFKQADAKRAEFIQLIERLTPMVLAQE